MKKLLYLAGMMVIIVILASCCCRKENRKNIVAQHTFLLDRTILKGKETNVDILVKKGERPNGIHSCGRNFFWIELVSTDTPEQVKVPYKKIEIIDLVNITKKTRNHFVLLKDGEIVNYAGGVIVRTWDRAIMVRYIYEE